MFLFSYFCAVLMWVWIFTLAISPKFSCPPSFSTTSIAYLERTLFIVQAIVPPETQFPFNTLSNQSGRVQVFGELSKKVNKTGGRDPEEIKQLVTASEQAEDEFRRLATLHELVERLKKELQDPASADEIAQNKLKQLLPRLATRTHVVKALTHFAVTKVTELRLAIGIQDLYLAGVVPNLEKRLNKVPPSVAPMGELIKMIAAKAKPPLRPEHQIGFSERPGKATEKNARSLKPLKKALEFTALVGKGRRMVPASFRYVDALILLSEQKKNKDKGQIFVKALRHWTESQEIKPPLSVLKLLEALESNHIPVALYDLRVAVDENGEPAAILRVRIKDATISDYAEWPRKTTPQLLQEGMVTYALGELELTAQAPAVLERVLKEQPLVLLSLAEVSDWHQNYEHQLLGKKGKKSSDQKLPVKEFGASERRSTDVKIFARALRRMRLNKTDNGTLTVVWDIGQMVRTVEELFGEARHLLYDQIARTAIGEWPLIHSAIQIWLEEIAKPASGHTIPEALKELEVRLNHLEVFFEIAQRLPGLSHEVRVQFGKTYLNLFHRLVQGRIRLFNTQYFPNQHNSITHANSLNAMLAEDVAIDAEGEAISSTGALLYDLVRGIGLVVQGDRLGQRNATAATRVDVPVSVLYADADARSEMVKVLSLSEAKKLFLLVPACDLATVKSLLAWASHPSSARHGKSTPGIPKTVNSSQAKARHDQARRRVGRGA